MIEPDAERPANVVRIKVCQARALKIMDTSMFGKGSSDPLAILKVGGRAVKTKVVKKSLAPVWDETHRFELAAAEAKTEGEIVVEVEDWDQTSSNDLIGRIAIKLSDLLANRASYAAPKWYPLEDESGNPLPETLGEVEVAIEWLHDPEVGRPIWELPDLSDKPPNNLQIAVIAARGLKIMDTNMFSKGGSSDPLVKINVGDRELKTTVQKKTTAPVWDERFEVPLRAEDATTLRLTVEDWDFSSGNDEIGHVEIALQPLADKQEVRKWHMLTDAQSGQVGEAGEVECALRHSYSAALDRQFFTDEDTSGKPPNELQVALIAGRKLKIMDTANMFSKGGGSTDALAKFTVGGKEFSTEVQMKNCNPIWNETFEAVLRAEDVAEVKTLRVHVEDWDRASGNDALGYVDVALAPLSDRTVLRKWHVLTDATTGKAGDCGEIEIALRHRFNPDHESVFFEEPDELEKPANELRIAVVAARNLKEMDKSMFSKNGSSDPIIKLSVEKREFKTAVQRKTTNPVYNETFDVYLPADSLTDASVLSVQVDDWDMASANDPIGHVVIPLAPLADRQLVRRWHPLTDAETGELGAGEVELVLRHWHNPALEYFTEADLYPEREPNLLRVAIIRGSNLRIMDTNMFSKGGASDPRVDLRVGDREAKSSTQKKTINPQWNEVLELPVDVAPGLELELRVVDIDDVSSADFMGRATIALDPLADKHVERRTLQLLDEDGGSGENGELEVTLRWVYSTEVHGEYFTEYDDELTRAPNELKIALVQARNLPIMDRAMLGFGKGGSSDPEVVFSVGEQTVKSTVKKKSLSPVWREVFTIPNVVLGGKQSPILTVTVQDVDLASGADFMGCVRIPLIDMHSGTLKRAWWPLEDEDADEDDIDVRPETPAEGAAGTAEGDAATRGEVELVLRWVYNPELEVHVADDDPTTRPPNSLCIVLGQARDLIARDRKLFGGTPSSDPIVRITATGVGAKAQSVTSTTKMKTLSPIWNERFVMRLRAADVGLHGNSKAMLSVVVEDWDVLGNDFLGEVCIPLDGLLDKHTERQWFPLGKEGGLEDDEERGEVLLNLKWVFDPQIDPDYFSELDPDPHPGQEPNELRIALVRARALPTLHGSLLRKGGLADPVVTITTGDQTCRSTVQKGTSEPEWNELFSLRFDVQEDPSAVLDVILEDWDAVMPPESIGLTRIPLLALNDKLTRRKFFALTNSDDVPAGGERCGQVELVLKAVYNEVMAAERESLGGRVRRAKKKWNFDDSATELSLRRGTVSAIDASLISAVLLSPALALVKLDLRTSQMGAREVASVANGLAKNNTLTFLNLSGNALSDGAIVSGEYEQAKLPPNGGLAALGACLRVNTALQKLDLSENRIEAKGLAALSRGLKDNVGLTELNAKNNTVVSISKCAWGTFDATGITGLAEALKFNSTLTMINLAQNQLCGLTAQAKGRFNASGILALAPRLRFNTTLKQLNLSDNAIIESGGRPIMEDVLACTGFKLAEKLDKGKRRYCILRRHMDTVRKANLDSIG